MLLFFHFLATCKHYDGVIWPEIKDMNFCINTNTGYATRAKNLFLGFFSSKNKKESTETSSGEQVLIDVKSLTTSNHVELRKKALSVYLNSIQDSLSGPETTDDPINVIRTTFAIYLSLHNHYVYYNWQGAHWRFQETTDVSI